MSPNLPCEHLIISRLLKVSYTEPFKYQFSISPLVLVIFKSPTPTVMYATSFTLVIPITITGVGDLLYTNTNGSVQDL